MLHEVGVSSLTQPVFSRLCVWLHCCQTGLTGYQGGIPVVDLFVSVLEELAQLLQPTHDNHVTSSTTSSSKATKTNLFSQ